MAINFKRGNIRLYIYLGGLVLIGLTWRAGGAIAERLSQLTVKTAPRVDRNAVSLDAKSFYQVWVKQSVAMPPAQTDGEVDAFFKRRVEVKQAPPKPTEPDYADMFRQTASVDGVADDGVFVSGKFYKVGDKLEDFAIATASGHSIVPFVESIKQGRVMFRIGKGTIAFLYGRGQ